MLPELNEIDLEYNTIHSNSNDFGLKNPTATVKHIPTGLTAECNYERSWMYNRKIAIGMLTQQVYDYHARYLNTQLDQE
jgi:protein subunit release factor A